MKITDPTRRSARPTAVALDWGTTALRAYLLASNGVVLSSRSSNAGIMSRLSPAAEGGFDGAFNDICGSWLDIYPDLMIIAAGMVGSAQGWTEVPYVKVPTGVKELVEGIRCVTTGRGYTVHIVPGVLEESGLPNVMRGEETQIVGALASDAALSQGPDGVLIGLPGTHAKWAFVKNGLIQRFLTFMTGEVFAVLRANTILGRTMKIGLVPNDGAFRHGVITARELGAPGLLSTIFSTRTLGLTGQLSAEEQSEYLSGLLIGHELRGLEETLNVENTKLSVRKIRLIGTDELCDRYIKALEIFECGDVSIIQHATEIGLHEISCMLRRYNHS